MTADDAAITTAEAFAREVEQGDREYVLRQQEAENEHGRALARVWAPVVAAFIVGLFAMISFLTYQVSTEHAKRITVWCYADPNSDRATSQFTGSRDDVKGLCPDAQPNPWSSP